MYAKLKKKKKKWKSADFLSATIAKTLEIKQPLYQMLTSASNIITYDVNKRNLFSIFNV